jgi:hypothetical protein
MELVRAGELSAKTKKRLKDVCQAVTDDRIAAAYAKTESSRVDYMTNALLMGMLLLGRKQALKHGHFMAFSAAVWAKLNPGKAQPEEHAVKNFCRSLRDYTFLAQRFISDIEQDTFAPEYRDQVVTPPAVSTEDIVTLVRTGEETNAMIEAIRTFVAGRSKRRMLIDFRNAETASDDEAAAESAEAEKRRSKKLPEQTPGQMDFLNDILNPIQTVDTLMDDIGFVRRTNREFWTNLANKLESQATKARALAKEIAK